ncbi:hypothetical protein RRG08_014863 [Elysia crispata]|uniref:Uncharacterized protein n=1 Tax=Elysia crispata TaxID=231223 RepID=A0AAE1E130_9GAST|nr:hypothetical protein RRG08_014863 [Elysia crispata]
MCQSWPGVSLRSVPVKRFGQGNSCRDVDKSLVELQLLIMMVHKKKPQTTIRKTTSGHDWSDPPLPSYIEKT